MIRLVFCDSGPNIHSFACENLTLKSPETGLFGHVHSTYCAGIYGGCVLCRIPTRLGHGGRWFSDVYMT